MDCKKTIIGGSKTQGESIMTFILISGESNVGKTTVCNKLHDKIVADQSFTVHGNKQYARYTSKLDFIAHYEKNQEHIVLNTPSDTDERMEEFANYLDNLAATGVRPDVIITTIRENNNGGYLMCRMLELLEACANGIPNLENYYKQNIASITSFVPRTLSRHAFVLHLKKQNNMNTIALDQYLDNNADKLKSVLDLVL